MADTDPEALEREIERTRAELATTVDAIADRVSPKRVAGRQMAKVKATADHLLTSTRDLLTPPPAYGDEQDEPQAPPSLAPILIGIGAALAVAATITLWRRRRR
ncbi:hypothetical protein GCM10009677_10480 [Sphaerisporangium rubeum]|uniref:MYXO-CTERM domain-containing protein n=1 Tax=Sphaerisporangium rubeum TaxID=321317 RepID=A0A7X0IC27_9ACTN|nr:DUF3618 domain-containing protein [Sphaerisporangium rubeum]MBB6472330.1 MYXO-CTERM domain-containing protein [Sphaerisporangium rubeum]